MLDSRKDAGYGRFIEWKALARQAGRSHKGGCYMTKQQIEKKYNVKLEREINPYMGGRYFWSVKDEAGKEIERCETLDDVAETLRIVRAM